MTIDVDYKISFFDATGGYLGETAQFFNLRWEWHENMLTWAIVSIEPTFFRGSRSHWLRDYNRVKLMRSSGGRPYRPVKNMEWLILHFRKSKGTQRRLIINMGCLGWILGDERGIGRLVAFKAASAQASKQGTVDALAKEIMEENFGVGAVDYEGNSRDISQHLRIDGELENDPTPAIDYSFSFKTLRRALDHLAAYSARAGVVWLYDVVSTGSGAARFATYIGSVGEDRGEFVFSEDIGNVGDITIDHDFRREVNAAYIGGQGVESNRQFAAVIDTDSSRRSPFSLRERMRSYPSLSLAVSLGDAGRKELSLGAARRFVTIDVLQTPESVMGVDWNPGDVVGWYDKDFDVSGRDRIAGVSVSFENGRETVSARLYSGTPLAGLYDFVDESEIQL